jgi:hypothetical protein
VVLDPYVGTKPLKVSTAEALAVFVDAEAVAFAAVEAGVNVKAEAVPTSFEPTSIAGLYDVDVVTFALIAPSRTTV